MLHLNHQTCCRLANQQSGYIKAIFHAPMQYTAAIKKFLAEENAIIHSKIFT